MLNEQSVSHNETLSNIYSDIYAQEGFVDNLIRIMSFHPEFLKEFIGFSNYLMYGQHGALSYDTRHFIAIMASARHRCIYLVKQQEQEFLSQNGKKTWVRNGLDAIPDKLKELNEINKILCHQPWLLSSAHIEKILKSNWTVTELLMAVTILTHFHALSGFVFGCGINENFIHQIEIVEEKRIKEERERKRQEEIKALIELERKRKKTKNCENLDEDEDDEFEDEDYDENYGEEFFGFEIRPTRPSRSEFRSAEDFYRARSDSTGTSNRTLSNSSASSCELGIDMLLKEMQMLQNEDIQCKNLSKSSNISIGHPSNNKLFFSSPSGSSPLIFSTNYLSDLSNTKLESRHAHLCVHDTNNNLPSMLLNDENLDEALDECICGESYDSSKKKIKTNSIKLCSSNSSSCTSNYISKSYTDCNETARLNVDLPVNASSKAKKLPKLSPMHEKCKLYLKKYEYESDFSYIDFDKVDQSLRLEYYTWDNQGYCTALSLYPDICEYLDKNFKVAVNMTYNT